jgi:hypothetical protein
MKEIITEKWFEFRYMNDHVFGMRRKAGKVCTNDPHIIYTIEEKENETEYNKFPKGYIEITLMYYKDFY